jgi:amidohydrolase
MQKNELKEKIKSLSNSYLQEIIDIRRHLHTIPEIGFHEFETSAFIAGKLKEFGIPFIEGIAVTGIVGTIVGKDASKKTIALRADMDALPITETDPIDYVSRHPGMMHACGHDVHVACLLGTAKILNGLKNEFEGTIKLFFQPSEETFPGGAKAMIEEGAMENPQVENVFAQHVFPQVNSGKIGIKGGKYMASTDEIYITVKGKGGHAATPELNVNPLNIAASIILELEKEFDKNKPQDSRSVMAFGKIIGEGRTNVIPDEVKLEGTIRTYDENWRVKVHRMVETLSSEIARKMKGSCEVHIAHGYPMLVNDEALTAVVKEYAEEYLGKENVVDLDMRMTSEDFAYFAKKVPSVFYRLGVRNEARNITSNLHTSTFNIDESCMNIGMGLMAWIALNRLK